MNAAIEANYDGLAGPTHNYAGLSAGNRASQTHAGLVAHPKEAALQGLAKMKRLMDLGLVQGVLPPQERPFLPLLRDAGFTGRDEQIWAAAWRDAPELAAVSASSAFMWAANAATVSPSADAADGRLHLTPANLVTMLHRRVEADQTRRALLKAFPRPDLVAVHAPLTAHPALGDEGAANHTRLSASPGAPGVEVFVYGREGGAQGEAVDLRVPARQTRLTGESIARRHQLDPHRVVHLRQSREALEAGAFHNDVVSVGAGDTLLLHAHAYADGPPALEAIRRAADGLFALQVVSIGGDELPLTDAIQSYLFNSQLLQIPGETGLLLLAPAEAEENTRARAVCARLEAEGRQGGPITRVEFIDVRQSMRNGGGPACLRLRVVLTPEQQTAANPAMLLNDELYGALTAWVERHYRDDLAPADMRDPNLIRESQEALDALCGILKLGGGFYPFQRTG